MTREEKELNCSNCRIGDFKENLCDCNNGFCAKYKGIGTEEDLFKAIEALSVANLKEEFESADAVQGEWIPCSERLPSKNQEVLLQCHHNMIVGYWMDGDFDGEKEWRALSGDGWENGCDFPTDVFEPLAWMPLPDPYREESEA